MSKAVSVCVTRSYPETKVKQTSPHLTERAITFQLGADKKEIEKKSTLLLLAYPNTAKDQR